MNRRPHLRSLAAGLLLGVCLTVSLGQAPPPATRPATSPAERKLALARKWWDYAVQKSNTGQVSFTNEDTIGWSKKLMEAERDLAPTPAARRAALQGHRDRVENIRRRLASQYNIGLVTYLPVIAAEYAEAEADQWIEDFDKSNSK